MNSRDSFLMKVGGVSAIVWVVMQVVGNLLHPSLPNDAARAMAGIHHSGSWGIAHLILISDYFVLVPLAVGLEASFAPRSRLLQIAVPLIVTAVAIGVVQVAIHPSVLPVLAHAYADPSQVVGREYVELLYQTIWLYNVALEVGHLVILYLAIGLASLAMRTDALYPRWLAWLGMLGALAAIASTVIGVVVLQSSRLGNYITFGFGLAPLAVWLVATGVALLRGSREPAPVGARQAALV
jgi:hypothetical protein